MQINQFNFERNWNTFLRSVYNLINVASAVVELCLYIVHGFNAGMVSSLATERPRCIKIKTSNCYSKVSLWDSKRKKTHWFLEQALKGVQSNLIKCIINLRVTCVTLFSTATTRITVLFCCYLVRVSRLFQQRATYKNV